jgi:ankyrin repeat protein
MQDPFALARDGDVEALRDLIEMDGFDINTVRWSGFTLLHRAAESGHTQLCEYLISQGSKVNLKTTWGWFTPFACT